MMIRARLTLAALASGGRAARIFRSLALVGMVFSFDIRAEFHVLGFDDADVASTQVLDLGAGVVQGLDVEDLYLTGTSSAEMGQLSAQVFRHAYTSDVQNLMFPVFVHLLSSLLKMAPGTGYQLRGHSKKCRRNGAGREPVSR
tara:strand:- start:102 stop:530 length:429 start_codon:yes stop_codon:yes gene_type:complete